MFGTDPRHSETSFVTPLTDISANIFAMMILILIWAMASQPSADPTGAANEEFSAVDRRPMTAADLIQHLYDRRSGAGPIRLDVQDSHVTVIAADGSMHTLAGETVRKDLSGHLRGAAGGPVRLYVFSHNWYASVLRPLRMTGRSWQEISVPQALRGAGGTGWSPEFAALLARPGDPDSFRTALARLLAAKPSQADAGQDGGASAPRRSSSVDEFGQQARPLGDRIADWWRRAVAAIAVLAAFVVILAIERKASR